MTVERWTWTLSRCSCILSVYMCCIRIRQSSPECQLLFYINSFHVVFYTQIFWYQKSQQQINALICQKINKVNAFVAYIILVALCLSLPIAYISTLWEVFVYISRIVKLEPARYENKYLHGLCKPRITITTNRLNDTVFQQHKSSKFVAVNVWYKNRETMLIRVEKSNNISEIMK